MMVPFTVVPFFNSIVTVSLLSFICGRAMGLSAKRIFTAGRVPGERKGTHEEPVERRGGGGVRVGGQRPLQHDLRLGWSCCSSESLDLTLAAALPCRR